MANIEKWAVNTVAQERFSGQETVQLAALIYKRFGRDKEAAAAAWRRLLGNTCSDAQFLEIAYAGTPWPLGTIFTLTEAQIDTADDGNLRTTPPGKVWEIIRVHRYPDQDPVATYDCGCEETGGWIVLDHRELDENGFTPSTEVVR